MTVDERLAAAGLPPLPRRAWLEIDEDALRNNVAVIREMIGPRVELSAVVKADAYGHGLVPVARVFEVAGVDRLCVASIDEAIALRDAAIHSAILVLYPVTDALVATAEEHGIQLTMADDGIGTEIEVETGLTRGGMGPGELASVLERSRHGAHGHGSIGVWTHLASPEDAAATAAQIAEFERAVELLRGVREGAALRRHVAATGGLLSGRAPAYEGVRMGLALYGLVPDDLPVAEELRGFARRLTPAMQLKAMPLRVETFPAGTAVSYGGRWVAQRESVIATLPVGYGDGWSRAYTNVAQAIVRGNRVPLVGSVAMDAVMADVTDVRGVGLDDEFVLLGRQGPDFIDANELARVRNTIPWEVVTSMAYRLPRVYHAASVLKGLRTLAGEVRVSGEA